MADKDGAEKNTEVVLGQIRDGAKVLRAALKDTWHRMGEAADDHDIPELGHLLTAVAGDVLKFFLSLDRLWLYVLIAAIAVYAGSYTGLYQWPIAVEWRGFQ